jgi:hypothetical protein
MDQLLELNLLTDKQFQVRFDDEVRDIGGSPMVDAMYAMKLTREQMHAALVQITYFK